MQNNCYLLELRSEASYVFGAFDTSLAMSLTDQKDASFNTHLKSLLYTAASWEYSKGFDLSFERECGIIQTKTKTNQEQNWGFYWDSQQQWTKWNLLVCTKHTKINIFHICNFLQMQLSLKRPKLQLKYLMGSKCLAKGKKILKKRSYESAK